MLPSALTRRALVVVPFLLSSVIGLTAQKPPAQQPAPVAGLRVERLETDAAATPLGIDDATPRLRWILDERSPERDADQRARARRVEARAGTRGQGRRVGLGKRHVRGSVGRLRRSRAQVGDAVLLERARVGGKRSGKRLGRARVVRDGTAQSERLARPVDRRARAARPAQRRRRRRRRCGDSRGGRVLPSGGMADERLVGLGEEEQPGRVPRAPAGADAAPLVPRRRNRWPARGSTHPASPTRRSPSTAAGSPIASWSRHSPTTRRRCSTPPTT